MSALPATAPQRVRLFRSARAAERLVAKASHIRIVELAPPTLAANANGFPQGRHHGHRDDLGGAAKAKALASAPEGEVSPYNPASFLQEQPDVTIVCDRAVAADLRNIPTIEKPHA
jgi:hypothetical protein